MTRSRPWPSGSLPRRAEQAEASASQQPANTAEASASQQPANTAEASAAQQPAETAEPGASQKPAEDEKDRRSRQEWFIWEDAVWHGRGSAVAEGLDFGKAVAEVSEVDDILFEAELDSLFEGEPTCQGSVSGSAVAEVPDLGKAVAAVADVDKLEPDVGGELSEILDYLGIDHEAGCSFSSLDQ